MRTGTIVARLAVPGATVPGDESVGTDVSVKLIDVPQGIAAANDSTLFPASHSPRDS